MTIRIYFLLITVVLLHSAAVNAQNCVDIKTEDLTGFLNKKIKPNLDLKLDKTDGFLAINRQRQNLHMADVTVSPISRTWNYSFNDVRRMDSNFFYDSKTNSVVLDVKFEKKGFELKGLCHGCFNRFKDSRAPDVNWVDPQILRIYLKPIIYQRSVSFNVTDVKMIGNLYANGFGDLIPNLTEKIASQLNIEVKKIFNSGETQRLFNDALKPLLDSNKVGSLASVSMASRSMRVCK
tara:strand:- start:242 stop:949 length:708 start_codon:yes stop_codon:yes gene_type:complete